MSLLRLEAERQPVDVKAYRGAFASEVHASKVVAEPCAVYVDGGDQPSIVYLELEERFPQAVAALRSIRKFTTAPRLRGLPNSSRTFGYAPPSVNQGRETCTEAALARDEPGVHAAITGLASVVEREYERYNAEAYAEHEATVAKVLPEWRLSGGVFTSGIINYNSKLPYHFDGGNFPACWSNMLVFKASCQGGDLVLPELGLTVRLRDHSLFMFDGQKLLHGVTPFRFVRPTGYRYSVVFYSLQQMWRCDSQEELVAASARRRTERERRRVDPAVTAYAIPSRGRAGSLPVRTLSVLRRLDVDLSTVRVFVAAEEWDEYRTALDVAGYREVLLDRGAHGMAAQRHAILQAYEPGTRLVQIDDDAADLLIRRSAKVMEPVEASEWRDLVEEAFHWCRRLGARLWGIYPVCDPFYMRPRIRGDLTYICGNLYGCVVDDDGEASPLWPQLEDKEDFERTLQCYSSDGAVVRVEYVAAKTRYYDEPGGMQADGLRSELRIRSSADVLCERFPDLATLNLSKASGHAELRLRDRTAPRGRVELKRV